MAISIFIGTKTCGTLYGVLVLRLKKLVTASSRHARISRKLDALQTPIQWPQVDFQTPSNPASTRGAGTLVVSMTRNWPWCLTNARNPPNKAREALW